MEPGESAAEACEREVLEETGPSVHETRLVGIYSHSDQLIIYPDGGRFQIVALHFEAEITGGEPGLSRETSDVGYFTRREIEVLEMFGRHKERIIDTLEKRADAFIR